MSGLAIDGGRPVRSQLLPYGHHCIDEGDVEAVVAALRSDWLTTGPRVEEFELAFAAKVGAPHAVAFSSGTAALHGAAWAAGIGPGDEAIVPPLTFAATSNAVLYQGGKVVFTDVRPDTLCLDLERAGAALTPRTKAIITVDYAGHPSDLKALLDLARDHGVVLIEDACHALGARQGGRRIGSIADLTVFSLHPAKHITTAEGGVVTTADGEVARQLRTFRNHGITTDQRQREAACSWEYEMVALGYNYRLSDVQCALGTSQLHKLPRWLARRRALVARYDAAFRDVPALETPVTLGDCEPAWHLYAVRLRAGWLRHDRGAVFRALRAENIGVNVHYVPVPWHPYYRELGYERGGWPVAEREYERLLTLPLFPAMEDSDLDDVVTAVKKVLSAYAA